MVVEDCELIFYSFMIMFVYEEGRQLIVKEDWAKSERALIVCLKYGEKTNKNRLILAAEILYLTARTCCKGLEDGLVLSSLHIFKMEPFLQRASPLLSSTLWVG